MVQHTDLLPLVRADVDRSRRTVKDLAEAADIGRITLGRRLNGTSPFTWDELYRLGRALGVKPSAWFAQIDEAS